MVTRSQFQIFVAVEYGLYHNQDKTDPGKMLNHLGCILIMPAPSRTKGVHIGPYKLTLFHCYF